ncbi:AI-2E family transporter [Rhodobium gokarnense]|uniref:PurR-regulated permease PerM n=1 Tax=Rhodobium gokarnense TaxID=364296 RepID=A0ABT3HFK0_9HYPH|nr:AI-2E family transporter [Rhodobium gokarnense]MCW2309182.1 putative PurR-regulated permease PerM [Rhodobium gokarnense]
MSLGRQVSFWVIALAVTVLVLWVLRGILLPFVAGMVLAYLLDPVADWLENHGIGRLFSTVIILVFFIIGFVLALVIFVPLLGHQLSGFVANLPSYAEKLQGLAANFLDGRAAETLGITTGDLQGQLGDFVKQGASWLASLAKSLWSGGQSLLSVLSLLVVTPVVAFYMLNDWDRMVATVDSWLPRQHRDTIHRLARDMDASISGFMRGQMMVCVILGTYYSVSLSVVGLNFGFLIGIIAGIISFIPYVGAAVGFVLSVGVALMQFWPDYTMIAVVVGVFVVGQFLEGNILQPKMIGESIGLHPVWLMFALFAFGSLFGFVGMLLAVPVAAMVGVLARFAIEQYLQSSLYRGPPGAGGGEGE